MRAAHGYSMIVMMLWCGGCAAWPAAVHVHGPVRIDQTPIRNGPPPRVVLIKYWQSGERLEFIGAEATMKPETEISFPLRFYLAIFTPALGVQGVVPDAGVIAFSGGCWPFSAIQNDLPRTDAAPDTGLCKWHVVLQTTEHPPAPANYGFPTVSADELDRVLCDAKMPGADRAMCREQLQRLLEYRRSNPAKAGGLRQSLRRILFPGPILAKTDRKR